MQRYPPKGICESFPPVAGEGLEAEGKVEGKVSGQILEHPIASLVVKSPKETLTRPIRRRVRRRPSTQGVVG